MVLDLCMPGMGGLELQRALAALPASLPVIMLSGHADVPTAVTAMREGAVHFLEKPVAPDLLIRAVRDALTRDEQRRSVQSERAEIQQRLARLTDRERDVLSLLVEAKSVKVIARCLGTSPNTVRNQRTSILQKMGADSVADLVRMMHLVGEAGSGPPSPNVE